MVVVYYGGESERALLETISMTGVPVRSLIDRLCGPVPLTVEKLGGGRGRQVHSKLDNVVLVVVGGGGGSLYSWCEHK